MNKAERDELLGALKDLMEVAYDGPSEPKGTGLESMNDWRKRIEKRTRELMEKYTTARTEEHRIADGDGHPPKYTVVVVRTHHTAGSPNWPVTAYVLETARLSQHTFQDFREAAEKGGCAVSFYVVPDSGIEHVKYELLTFSGMKAM